MLEAVQFLKIIVTVEPNFRALKKRSITLILQTSDYMLSQNLNSVRYDSISLLGIKSEAIQSSVSFCRSRCFDLLLYQYYTS